MNFIKIIYFLSLFSLFSHYVKCNELYRVGPQYFLNYNADILSTDNNHPSTIQLSNGNTVVVWNGPDIGNHNTFERGIIGKIINDDIKIVVNDFHINVYTKGSQIYPSVNNINGNKFVVTWQSRDQDGDGYGIIAQIFNNDGSKIGNEFLVNTNLISHQTNPKIIGLSDTKFVIVWESKIYQVFTYYDIHCQIFNNDGSKFGTEIYISDNFIERSNRYSNDNPNIIDLLNNKFLIIYDSGKKNARESDIYGKIYNYDGTLYKDMFLINTYSSFDQVSPSVGLLSNGNFVVTWKSSLPGDDIAIFTNTGNKIEIENNYIGFPINSKVIGLSNDKFVISWSVGTVLNSQVLNNDGTIYSDVFQVNKIEYPGTISISLTIFQNTDILYVWSTNSPNYRGLPVENNINAQVYSFIEPIEESTEESTEEESTEEESTEEENSSSKLSLNLLLYGLPVMLLII